MMQILQTPRFSKQLKKLKPNQKEALDKAIQAVIDNPLVGVQKRGDLDYLHVYKFIMLNAHGFFPPHGMKQYHGVGKIMQARCLSHVKQQALLAYSYDAGSVIIKLLGIGSHENFYRDLKR